MKVIFAITDALSVLIIGLHAVLIAKHSAEIIYIGLTNELEEGL